MINYKDYLESFAWKAIKKAKLEEQQICECCNANAATTVHHLSYERLWHEREDDIVSICETCHYECHHVNGYQIKNEEELLRQRFNEISHLPNAEAIKIIPFYEEIIFPNLHEKFWTEELEELEGRYLTEYWINNKDLKKRLIHLQEMDQFGKPDAWVGLLSYIWYDLSPYDKQKKYLDFNSLKRLDGIGDWYTPSETYIDRHWLYYFEKDCDSWDIIQKIRLYFFPIPNLQQFNWKVFHDRKHVYAFPSQDSDFYKLPWLNPNNLEYKLNRYLLSWKIGYDIYRDMKAIPLPNSTEIQVIDLNEKVTSLRINYLENEYGAPLNFEECWVEPFAVNESNNWWWEHIQIKNEDIDELVDWWGISIVEWKIICLRTHESKWASWDDDFENDGRYYDVYDSGPEFTYEMFYKIHELPEDYNKDNYIIWVTWLEEDKQWRPLYHYSLYDGSKYYYEQGVWEYNPTCSNKMRPTCLLLKKTYLISLWIDVESFIILSPNYVADENNLYYIDNNVLLQIAQYDKLMEYKIIWDPIKDDEH